MHEIYIYSIYSRPSSLSQYFETWLQGFSLIQLLTGYCGQALMMDDKTFWFIPSVLDRAEVRALYRSQHQSHNTLLLWAVLEN